MAEAIGNRVVRDLEIPCPAGVPIGETLAGSGCHCRIENSVIVSALDPSTLGRFCTPRGGYLLCPTWQAEKHRIWQGITTPLVEMEHPEVVAARRAAEHVQSFGSNGSPRAARKRLSAAARQARNTEILHLRERGLTYEEIGKRVGVTRERVGQVVKQSRIVGAA